MRAFALLCHVCRHLRPWTVAARYAEAPYAWCCVCTNKVPAKNFCENLARNITSLLIKFHNQLPAVGPPFSGPGVLVLHFQVLHFPPLTFGPSVSILHFQFFYLFLVLRFLVLHFQSTRSADTVCSARHR